jgi:xanthine dehydrogenase small subunit
MVYANQRYERWPSLIALDAIPELSTLEAGTGELVIGAATPLSRLERWLHQQELSATALGQLLPLFASRLLRQRATVGGSLATASPIGDLAPALLALDAELTLASALGERRLPLTDFFVGYRKTARLPGELIARIHVPLPLARTQRFYKVSKRVLDDISSVAGAFALELDAGGAVARLRLAYGGIAATPLRAYDVEEAARGRPWSRATLSELTPALHGVGAPLSDHRASADYRRAMIVRLFERFFEESAKGGAP